MTPNPPITAAQIDQPTGEFANLPGADWRYWIRPHDYPEPCPWCGGRLRHSDLCEELRASWEPELPFGKHKCRRVSEVPRDYFEWLARRQGIESELRDVIKTHLGWK